MSTDKVVTEIENNEEAMGTCQDIQGSLNDVVNHIDDDNPVKALEVLDELQEEINSLHVYLTDQVESQKPNG
jgi:hypothetical protein